MYSCMYSTVLTESYCLVLSASESNQSLWGGGAWHIGNKDQVYVLPHLLGRLFRHIMKTRNANDRKKCFAGFQTSSVINIVLPGF